MKKSIGTSLKWSTAGEALAKLIAPVTNIILARILAPEDFGVLATVNMIITFVDLFTDSGFAKYIIQCDFAKESEIEQYVNVAFWTNLILSIALWSVIYFFRYPIAQVVGNKGHENVIIIAATQLIITSFSSIQTALYRRNFDFKTLFIARVIISLIPLGITVPLAFALKNYWALVVGAIMQQLVNAIFLTIKSTWKPKIYFDFKKLRKMFSFSVWSLAEAVAYWLTTWFDVFIIGAAFSAYYLGIYKNSLNMVNSLMQLVKASIIPVLFSSLSRMKNSEKEFFNIYLRLQEIASFILIPMGMGLFVFSKLATELLLGNKWLEAANIVGVWALSSCFMATYVNFYGEVFKAKGKPKILFIYEIVCLVIMIPICYFAKEQGFWSIVYVRAGVVIIEIILGMLFLKVFIGFSIAKMIGNVLPSVICATIMAVFGRSLKNISDSIIWQFVTICCCVGIYFIIYILFFGKRLKNTLKTFREERFG